VRATDGFLSKNGLSAGARLCLNAPLKITEGRPMKNRSLILAAMLAAAGCATQEAPKPAPAPAPAPAPKPQITPEIKPAPAAKPEPKKPAVLNLSSRELFEFNKATLTNEAKAKLDAEVVAKLRDVGEVRYINVNGHADRLGSAQYNQQLSEKRAEAVRAYLVSKGVDPAKVETLGFGKTTPVKSCPDQKDRKALIECLAPNRRVEVEIQGTPR
jgi:OmpA-OmpF porin, OOP family